MLAGIFYRVYRGILKNAGLLEGKEETVVFDKHYVMIVDGSYADYWNDVYAVASEAAAENSALRVPTGQLNSLIADAMMMQQPPADKGRRLKIYYASQIGVKPPLFSFQINDRKLIHFSYNRYLENRIREAFGFDGTPIKFVFREKRKREQ